VIQKGLAGTVGRLQWLALALLAAGLPALQPALLLSWLAVGLTLLAALKLLEARRPQERRLVALLQLVCAGLLGALQPELGPSLLQLLAVLVALAGLLALESGAGLSWRLLLRSSLQVVAAALPAALALFLLLPRLEPFAAVPALSSGMAVSGLSESLAPGGIATLVSSAAAAARVSFGAAAPPPPPQRYWRVQTHERFDGERWTSASPGLAAGDRAAAASPPSAAAEGDQGAGSPAAPAAGMGIQLWLSEPSPLSSVPWSGSGLPLGGELRLERGGVLRHRGSPARRRLYAIATPAAATGQGEGPGAAWQREPPGPLDLQLPQGANPRLEALAAHWQRQGPARARLAAAEAWFRAQPFRYTQQPGTLPATAPLDAFLFERREGFCGHVASAFTALMRAAGVPARVVSGYRGGTWVEPLGGPAYLDLRQSDAHAWSEVWLADEGWRRVDPTAWLAQAGSTMPRPPRLDAGNWLVRQWWGLDLAWGRLWLGFDRDRQEALLQRLLGERRELVGVLVIGAVALGLAAGLAGLGWLRRQPGGDPARQELDRSLRLLARRGLSPGAGETLPRFSERLAAAHPELAEALRAVLVPYQRWRYAPGRQDREAERRLLGDLRRRRRRLRAVLQHHPAGRGPLL